MIKGRNLNQVARTTAQYFRDWGVDVCHLLLSKIPTGIFIQDNRYCPTQNSIVYPDCLRKRFCVCFYKISSESLGWHSTNCHGAHIKAMQAELKEPDHLLCNSVVAEHQTTEQEGSSLLCFLGQNSLCLSHILFFKNQHQYFFPVTDENIKVQKE